MNFHIDAKLKIKNNYSKDDVKVLADMYDIAKDENNVEDYEIRASVLKQYNYDITKINETKSIETTRGFIDVSFSVFSHIEQQYIFKIPYEDLPLHINDDYVEAYEPLKIILMWRLKIGK